jgi:hypothetical protein
LEPTGAADQRRTPLERIHRLEQRGWRLINNPVRDNAHYPNYWLCARLHGGAEHGDYTFVGFIPGEQGAPFLRDPNISDVANECGAVVEQARRNMLEGKRAGAGGGEGKRAVAGGEDATKGKFVCRKCSTAFASKAKLDEHLLKEKHFDNPRVPPNPLPAPPLPAPLPKNEYQIGQPVQYTTFTGMKYRAIIKNISVLFGRTIYTIIINVPEFGPDKPIQVNDNQIEPYPGAAPAPPPAPAPAPVIPTEFINGQEVIYTKSNGVQTRAIITKITPGFLGNIYTVRFKTVGDIGFDVTEDALANQLKPVINFPFGGKFGQRGGGQKENYYKFEQTAILIYEYLVKIITVKNARGGKINKKTKKHRRQKKLKTKTKTKKNKH